MNNKPISETEEMKELGEMIEKRELDPERTADYAQGKPAGITIKPEERS